jgi:ATP diphosphatase
VGELDEALAAGDAQAASDELGDVLFSVVSIARKHGIDAEAALRGTIDRFSARVREIERTSKARKVDPAKLTADQLDAL